MCISIGGYGASDVITHAASLAGVPVRVASGYDDPEIRRDTPGQGRQNMAFWTRVTCPDAIEKLRAESAQWRRIS